MASGNGEDCDPHGGARNLLLDCVGVKAGEQVLIVREDPALGYYDAAAPACVARGRRWRRARRLRWRIRRRW